MSKNKLTFYLIWVILVSLGPITVWLNSDFSIISQNKSLLTNFLQRIFGVMAFSMMFIQIIIGTYMQRWTEKFGGWVLRFHITEGVLIYTLVLLHPVLFVFFNYFNGKALDPIFVFLQLCVLCRTPVEYYYTLGRIGFWLTTVAVFAGLFRTATPFMRLHWKKFHVLNYLTFLIIGIHGLSLGTDFMAMPFFAFAIAAYLIVLYIVLIKKIPELYKNFRRYLA